MLFLLYAQVNLLTRAHILLRRAYFCLLWFVVFLVCLVEVLRMSASELVTLIWEDLTSVMSSAHKYLQERVESPDPNVRREVVRLMFHQEALVSRVLLCRPLPGETEAVQLAKLKTVENDVESHMLQVFYI